MQENPEPRKNFILEDEDDDFAHLSKKAWFNRAETYMAIAGFTLFGLILMFMFSGGEENPYLSGSSSDSDDNTAQTIDSSDPDQSDQATTVEEDNTSADSETPGEDDTEEDDDEPANTDSDDVSIVRAAVNGASIDLTLSYPGCGDHDFDLVLKSVEEDENPVQLNVAVIHDANGDTCERSNQSTETLDLSSILSEADNPRAYTMNLIDSAGNEIDFTVR